jgi:hypothetical protein
MLAAGSDDPGVWTTAFAGSTVLGTVVIRPIPPTTLTVGAPTSLLSAYTPTTINSTELEAPFGGNLFDAFEPIVETNPTLAVVLASLLSAYSPSLQYDKILSIDTIASLLTAYVPLVNNDSLRIDFVPNLFTAYAPTLEYDVALIISLVPNLFDAFMPVVEIPFGQVIFNPASDSFGATIFNPASDSFGATIFNPASDDFIQRGRNDS